MTVEKSTAAPAAPSASATPQRSKATAPGAPSASGFFAMLSAADDALALPLDGTTEGTPGKGRPGKGGLFGDADESEGKDGLAALSLLGLPLHASPAVPAAEAPAVNVTAHGGASATALAQRGGMLAQDTDAATSVGAALTKKPGKAMTAQLAEEPGKLKLAAQPGKDAAPQKAEPVALRTLVENMPVAPVERAQAAIQLIAGERRAPDQIGQKPAAAGPVYFQPQASSAPMGMDGVVATGAAAPMDTYVAEQVSYWITQDVQNAELTLDGVGHSPVEVSISMQGNEAQVAFHTDESSARQALENASEQLRDMLQRQGLVLAGVTVGNAQTGDSGQQQRRPRQEGGRQALVSSAESVSSTQAHRASRTTGGAVDLFV